jgi:hypothetical protein
LVGEGEVIFMSGKEKGSGTLFGFASFWERTFGMTFQCVLLQKYPIIRNI